MDPKLPGLMTALNDVEMYGLFSHYLDRIDVPGLDRVEHSLVKYKPGKRCVIEYRLWRGTNCWVYYGKLFRKNRGEKIFQNLKCLWMKWNEATGLPLMPEPAAYIGELGMVVQKAVIGTPFLEIDQLLQAVRYAANTLAELHELPALELERRSLMDHFQKYARPPVDQVLKEAPELAETVLRLESAFRHAAAEEDSADYRVVHGDVNPMQIFIHDERAYFVDFDGICLSHPALDVSNFLIAIKVRFPHLANELIRYFLENYLQRCPSIHLRGMRIYHALIYFRRAMIAFRQKQQSHRQQWVREFLEKALRYLNQPVSIAG